MSADPRREPRGPASPRGWWRRLAWFAGLWLASVLALALVAGVLRLTLKP